jgi:hypothetical protein
MLLLLLFIIRDFPLSDAKVESALQKEQRFIDSFIEQKSKTFICMARFFFCRELCVSSCAFALLFYFLLLFFSDLLARESELYQISQFIDRKSKTPLMLFGQRGVGKSSLVARWIDSQRQSDSHLNSGTECKIFYSFFGLIHQQVC